MEGNSFKKGSLNKRLLHLTDLIFHRTSSLESPPFLATLEKTSGKFANLISFAFWLSYTPSCSFSHATAITTSSSLFSHHRKLQ